MDKNLTKRERLLICISIGTSCAVGYFGYKYGMHRSITALANKNSLLENKVKVLQEAASEGLYEEAIATVTRKINHLKDQIEYCANRLYTNGNDIQTDIVLYYY